ncbi:MAG TPA: DUF302 domain-containing protein [Gemmatimonadales bacterium]|nr:DUF302 domain-containing protein [Gemmatimonadales bacterium]
MSGAVTDIAYGFAAEVPVGYDRAVELTRAALAERGFGVLTEIDVRATLQKKLGAEFRPYVILGACNPPIAHRVLTSELPVGLLLPCNVIVYAGERPGTSVVAVLDPVVQLGVTGREDMKPMATEARDLLLQALERVRETAADTTMTPKGH